jgi:SAM-dependent methyltransferase
MKNGRDGYFGDYVDSIFSSGADLSAAGMEREAMEYGAQYKGLLPEAKDAAILDAGSGAGHFLLLLKKSGYTNFTGVDVSPQQVEFCRANVSEKVVLADIFEYLKDKPEAFDLVSFNDVLEHFPKEKVVPLLSLAGSSLKVGGKLILRTPNLGNFFSVYARYKDFTHETGFTERSLRQVLWLAGFREISVFGAEGARGKGLKGKAERAVQLSVRYVLRKAFWYQGYVAPEILAPLLGACAVKPAGKAA